MGRETGKVFLALKLFLVWIFLLLFFVLIGGLIFGGTSSIEISDLANWDGRHFLDIAKYGYSDKIRYAFFPLYPFLIVFVSTIFRISSLYAAILINLILTFGIIYLFIKFLNDAKEKRVVEIISYFLIFPTSFYLIATYSESLFLALALLTFIFIQRKNYLWATFFAALTAITRVTGVAIILALWADVYLRPSPIKDRIIVLFAPLGLIAYCFLQLIETGNPLYFIVAEQNWSRGITFPGFNIWAALQYLIVYGPAPENFTILSDLVFTMFGLGMALRSIRFLKPAQSLYTFLSVLIPLVTSLLLSIPRFLLVIFPIYILISKTNRVFKISYIIISVVLLFLFINFFIRNIWVS